MYEFEIVTRLDRAAFLVMQGAELVGFEGKYWGNCRIILKVNQAILDTTKSGLVYYNKYMQIRRKLKSRIYKHYNVIRK